MRRINHLYLILIITTIYGCLPNNSTTIPTWTETFPPSTSIPKPIETSLAASSQVGCILPPIKVSGPNIGYFYWSENSESIIYKEKYGQSWNIYSTISGQTNLMSTKISPTPTTDFNSFDINNYTDAFISPSHKTILFTRGVPEKYSVYYKNLNENQEYFLDTIQGNIKEVSWFNGEKNAIIAMNWQAPVYPDAAVYLIDFSKNELFIEMPGASELYNIEYLGLTPDETRFLFVSYGNEQNDVSVRVWNISTNEIILTPIFNPLGLQWINESEFISISQNEELFSVVNILLYDINSSELTYLADKKFSVDPFINAAIQISPDGLSVAYIENETDNLYWVVCNH